jgi:imidazolonepropionase-like amidohydrolase
MKTRLLQQVGAMRLSPRFHSLAQAMVVFSLACSALVAWGAGPIAIQGAKIYPVAGDPIEEGVILIRNGRIEAVGTDIKIPGEARVIDASGMVVIPGIIDAHSSAAMSQANERADFVPFLSVVDSIDPITGYFEECRRNGVTTAAVVPGNSTLIGGQAAIVKTAGQYVNDMLLQREAGLKLSLRPNSGNRMSQLARLRKELNRAKQLIEREQNKEEAPEKKGEDAAEEKPAEDTPAEDAPADESEGSTDQARRQAVATSDEASLKALAAALQGDVPVYIYCENGMDVTAALALVKEYDFKPIFVLGRECYGAAELLGKREETVILDPTLVFWKTNERTREDEKIVLPKIYREAQVPFIFQTNDNASRSIGGSYFWYQAATGIKYGMSEAEALAALTKVPAELLKIDHLVGTIEVGKDADLVILTGEPFDITTWVAHTLVGGDIVYDRAKDEKLSRLLAPEAE